MHTCQGDLLRHIDCDSVEHVVQQSISNLLLTRDGIIVVFYENKGLATFTSAGKSLLATNLKKNDRIAVANPLGDERILCGQLSRDGEYVVVGTEAGRISILRIFPLQLLYTYPVSYYYKN